jgi:hypothetical protein
MHLQIGGIFLLQNSFAMDSWIACPTRGNRTRFRALSFRGRIQSATMIENTDLQVRNDRKRDRMDKRSRVRLSARKDRRRVDPAEAVMNSNPNLSPPLTFETPSTDS